MEEVAIIYEDEALLVINKPAGMIVYPDGKHDYPALSHWLEKKYGEGNFHFVHRIDRETSGVLVVARTEEVHEFLKNQFASAKLKNIPRVCTWHFKSRQGSDRQAHWQQPRRQRAALGKAAAWHDARGCHCLPVIERGNSVTYIEAFPKTGRTHQIRVHFSAVQHPIVADQLYAPSRAKILGFERLRFMPTLLYLPTPMARR